MRLCTLVFSVAFGFVALLTTPATAQALKELGEIPRGPLGAWGQGGGIDRSSNQASYLFLAFVSSGSKFGCAINLKKDDRIEFTNAGGIAAFKGGKGGSNNFSIISQVKADRSGEQVQQDVSKAKAYADKYFGTGEGKNKRDVFGSGERCEGGILICMPSAQDKTTNPNGIYTSENGCLKRGNKNNERKDNVRPDHVKHGFFLKKSDLSKSGRRQFTVLKDGPLRFIAWDRKFTDNSGYYTLVIKVLPRPQR